MILDLGRSAVRGRHNVFAVLTGSVRRPSSSGSWTADVGGGGVEFATAELGRNGWANPPNPAIFIDFSNREAEDHRICRFQLCSSDGILSSSSSFWLYQRILKQVGEPKSN